MTVILDNQGNIIRKLRPIHPGYFLKAWLAENENDRLAEIDAKTDLTREEFVQIVKCEKPIHEREALELSKVFGPAAELWFRMQFVFDEFEKNGREPEKSELPQLMRRVPESPVPA